MSPGLTDVAYQFVGSCEMVRVLRAVGVTPSFHMDAAAPIMTVFQAKKSYAPDSAEFPAVLGHSQWRIRTPYVVQHF
jgi:hypothetical protein